MPFVSQRQRRFLYAKHPEMARRWTAEAKRKGVPAVQPMRVQKLYSEWRPPTAAENVPDKVSTRRHGFLWRKKTTTRRKPVLLKTDEFGKMPASVHRYVRDYSEVKPGEAKRVKRFSHHVGGETGVAKYVKAADKEQISRHKKRQKRFSEASAALGLTALAAKSPTYAAALQRRVPKAPVGRLASLKPRAEKVAEHVVPASLGVGAMGSINFARLQGKEAKVNEPVRKGFGGSLKDIWDFKQSADKGAKKRRRKQLERRARATTRSRGGYYVAPGAKYPKRPTSAKERRRLAELEASTMYGGRALPAQFVRSDDYYRRYAARAVEKASWYPNVSTGAESAYKDLGQRKRKRYRDAAAHGSLAGAALTIGAPPWRLIDGDHTRRMPRGVRAALVGAGALSGTAAFNRAHEGRSLQERRGKIKAAGLERQRQGVLGRDRLKRDYPHLVHASKAMPTPPKAIPRPTRGTFVRMPSGKMTHRRGSIPGTAKR